MGFKVYQGVEKDANLLTIAKGGTVVSTGKADSPYDFQPAAEGKQSGSASGAQAADVAPVYINEDAGRVVIVKWDATAGTPPQGSVPRSQPAAVATPGPGQIRVDRYSGNMEDSNLDGAYVATLPSGWQAGNSIQFTTSLCGLDSYIVSYRTTGGASKVWHVVVTARKRIHCHLVEMKKGSAATPTFDDYRGPLAGAQRVFGDQFGIDLVFPDPGGITPEGTTPLHGPMTKDALYSMIRDAGSARRPPRDLWINVVKSIAGRETGWGGGSQVHLDVAKSVASQASYDSWLASWNSYEANTKGTTYPEHWVRTQNFAPDEKDAALRLAQGDITPAQLVRKERLNLALHEIGHALGLVPANGKAGGKTQPGWYDADRHHTSGHCTTKTCVMYWEGDLAQSGLGFRMGVQLPFDHAITDGCALFLRACDLHDLRILPQF